MPPYVERGTPRLARSGEMQIALVKV